MKRLFVLLTVAAFLLAIPASHLIWSKAHVPVNKEQVCHKGKVITVSQNAVQAHQNHGDCLLPACDFDNIFHTGEECDSNNPGGQCGLKTPRKGAEGTPGCPADGSRF